MSTIDEPVSEKRQLNIQRDLDSRAQAVTAYKDQLREKVKAEIAELTQERKEARQQGQADAAYYITEQIIEAQKILTFIDEP